MRARWKIMVPVTRSTSDSRSQPFLRKAAQQHGMWKIDIFTNDSLHTLGLSPGLPCSPEILPWITRWPGRVSATLIIASLVFCDPQIENCLSVPSFWTPRVDCPVPWLVLPPVLSVYSLHLTPSHATSLTQPGALKACSNSC
jgi:hypothetical protein